MEGLAKLSQIVVAVALVNIWVLRLMKPSPWRGADADSMKDEFKEYGLPAWSMLVVGALNLLGAALLLVGLWAPALARVTAGGLAVLMLGAVGMHLNIRDPLPKSLPAAGVLLLCLIIVAGA